MAEPQFVFVGTCTALVFSHFGDIHLSWIETIPDSQVIAAKTPEGFGYCGHVTVDNGEVSVHVEADAAIEMATALDDVCVAFHARVEHQRRAYRAALAGGAN